MDKKEIAITLGMILFALIVAVVIINTCNKYTFEEDYGTITDFRLILGGFGQPQRCEIETTTTKITGSHFDCDNLVVGKKISKEGNNCGSKLVVT